VLTWPKDALFVAAACVAAGVLLPQFDATGLLVLAAVLLAGLASLDWATEQVGRHSWRAMVAETLATVLLICGVVLATAILNWGLVVR
jgi:hypothetical protein